MDFEIPQQTRDFEREAAAVFSGPETAQLLQVARCRADGMDGDVRELYRHLGQTGILAPSWPSEFGGRELDFTATIALLEQMVQHGVPQSLYYISVQIVGTLLLHAGDEEQRRSLLPRLANGDLAACILFTEPEQGSDLASIATHARKDGPRWIINGRKIYNLKSAYADVALCAFRTDDQQNRYESITLFLIPLDAPGVTIRPIASMADEQFHDITFSDVEVAPSAILGGLGNGWALINRLFAAERSGLDYYARARHWLDLTISRLNGNRDIHRPETDLARLAHLRARLDAGRLLTCRALQNLQHGRPDIAEASLSKWHCSETSQAIAWWALDVLGLEILDISASAAEDAALEAAYREAPGMTISGGASEVLLDIAAGARLIDDVQPGAEAWT